MKTFGKQTYRLLDNTKPYQRPELRHAGRMTSSAIAGLETQSRVACSDLLARMFLVWKNINTLF